MQRDDLLGAISKQVAYFDINEGPSNPSAYAGFEEKPPSAPKLQSEGIVAVDNTQQFLDAAQKLDIGQLIKDPYFTLFESVSALEIMDPKMDSGCLKPGETMEDEFDFTVALLPEEVIGIIDQLLCHEMAWHKGHPLSQTIFTSLHIDRLLSPNPLSIDQTRFARSEIPSDGESMTHQILRAYCLGLIKTCWYVNNRVKSELYYEEEDFVTHTFNRSLLEGLDLTSVLELLKSTVDALSSSPEFSDEINDALVRRLQFRLTFLQTVETADSRTSSEELKTLWSRLQACLQFLKFTTNLGRAASSAFSVKLQRKLASTVPPRPIVQISEEAAFDHLDRLCHDGLAAVEVLDYHDSHSLMTFVYLFQARKPQPSVYIRTLLQHYLFSENIILGTMSIRQILDQDLACTVLPGSQLLNQDNDEIELPHDPRFSMASEMEIFRSRAAGPYFDILRTLCQNRCRIRRTLAHTIAEWDNLQLDAEEIDIKLRAFTNEEPIVDESVYSYPIYTFPLSSWALVYKLRQMELIIQLGFELETYAPDELARMYYYLKYVAQARIQHLERIQQSISRARRVAHESQNIRREKLEEYDNAFKCVDTSIMEAACICGFAGALYRLFTALRRLDLVPSPPRPYSDDKMRYEVRMKPFLSISEPELLTFEDLNKHVDPPDVSLLGLLNGAAESAVTAKSAFEIMAKMPAEVAFCRGSYDSWLKNVKDCMKALIFTNITIVTVKKAVEAAVKGGGKLKLDMILPESGKRYHDFWVVPKVTPVP